MGTIEDEMETAVVDRPANHSDSDSPSLLPSNFDDDSLLPEEIEYWSLLPPDEEHYEQ